MKYDLNKICIRAQVKGNWGSYTLQELFDDKEGGKILEWMLERILYQQIGIKEGEIVTKEHVQNGLKLMDKLGIPIVRLK